MKLQINESQNEQSEVSLENIEFKQSWRDEYIKWLNGLWVEFYFNQEKSLPNGLGEKLDDRLGNTQQL